MGIQRGFSEGSAASRPPPRPPHGAVARERPPSQAPTAPSRIDELGILLSSAADGDRGAFALLYRSTAPKLYGIALRILRRPDLAEDAIQDAYVRIWRRASDFDPTRAPAIAWMATIARNRAIEVSRNSRTASRADPLDALNIPCDRRDPEAEAQLSDNVRRLVSCLKRLGADQSGAVVLAYRDGWSREELALHYGRPVSTIKTWLRRGLINLRQGLED